MKKSKLLLFLLFVFADANAQRALVAAGGNATGSGGTASYSIGQIAYTIANGIGGSANQGVQIPFEIVTLSGQELTQISLQMIVYPNPTTSIVNLKIDNFDFQNLNYQLLDLNGREIKNQKITNSETVVLLENFTNSTYLLSVSNQNKIIKTFKIIKN